MEEAYTVLRTALAITLDLGFQAELSNCYYRLGNAARGVRRYAESRAAYTQALAVAQQLGAALNICYIQIGLSYVALSEGNDAEALRLAEEVLALSIQLGEGQNQRFALRNGALATRRLGEAQRAKGYVVRGLRLALATRQWAVCLGAVVLLLADSGAPEYAAALFDHAGWTHQVGNDTDSEDTEMREIRAILAALPPDVSAAAQARWAGYDYWAMLTELLAELEARGWGG
jgi:tetratricopeptide (TPR) repeat protein